MVNKAFPRPTAAAIIASLALSVFISPDAFGQGKQPAKAPAKRPVNQQTLLEDSEAAFGAKKYEEADNLYKTLIEKYADRMSPEQVGALTVRRAACQINRRQWAAAEPLLKDFLDLQKFPNGAGDILMPGNNFRGPALLSLAECQANQGKFDEAIAGLRMFSLAVTVNKFDDRMKALMYMADLTERKVEKGTPAEKTAAAKAAVAIIKPITQNSFTIPEVREAGYKLVGLYTKLGMAPEANQLRKELEAKLTNPADLVRSNFLKLELGDRYFTEAEALQGSDNPDDVAKRVGLYRQAIAAYQGVHRRKYIAAFMDKAVEQAEARVAQIKTRSAPPPPAAAGAAPSSNAVATGVQDGEDPLRKAEEDVEALKKIRESFQANKSYDSVLAYRLGLCLVELNRPWEARVAFKEIIDKDPEFEVPGPDGPEKKGDIAYYYYIICLNDIRRFDEAQEECKKFLAKYTKSSVLGNVAVMLGDISREQENYPQAVRNFRWALENVPALSTKDREYIDSVIADSLFRNVDWEDARAAIEKFLSTYPSSDQRESMTYMRALTFFYQGKYKETKAGFDEYRTSYPKGRFAADAAYRYALVILGVKPANPKEAQSNALNVVQRCDNWLAEYGDTTDPDVAKQIPEVINLKADAYNKISEIRELPKEEKAKYANLALEGYIATAMKAGDNKQVLDFALRELNKSLPARGEWKRLREIYEALYKRNPKSPEALGHLYWIIKCTERLGKTAEEKLKSSEEAKLILANAIVENINEVRQENVESLILELAQKLAREVRRREKLKRDNPAANVEEFDAGKELEKLLKLNENQDKIIAQARGAFAKAEIAKALRQPEKAADEYTRMARRFKPDELSPTILALLGDHLLASGKPDDAARYFTYLKDTFRGSSFADFAFAGLAQIALDKGKPKDALALAQEALENGIGYSRERDLRFLEARALLESGNLDEATKSFEGIAKVKEWRGEATAGCKYYLAVILERRGKYNEAHNEYQACYLQWKKYEKYSAKAVLAAAKILAEHLGRRADAVTTLNQQFFKNPDTRVQDRYKTTPEWAEAQKLLESLS